MASEFSHNEEQGKAQNNIYGDGQTPKNLSVAEAIDRLIEIVKKNEQCMAQAFANAPEWQSRAQMTMTTFKDGEKQKASHVVVNVPSTFSKEQKEILKGLRLLKQSPKNSHQIPLLMYISALL